MLSGKGGVGKSTVSAMLGWALSADEDAQVRLRLSPFDDLKICWRQPGMNAS